MTNITKQQVEEIKAMYYRYEEKVDMCYDNNKCNLAKTYADMMLGIEHVCNIIGIEL